MLLRNGHFSVIFEIKIIFNEFLSSNNFLALVTASIVFPKGCPKIVSLWEQKKDFFHQERNSTKLTLAVVEAENEPRKIAFVRIHVVHHFH